jgi:hypothetical protein
MEHGAWVMENLFTNYQLLTSVLKVTHSRIQQKRRLTFILGCEGSSWGVLHLKCGARAFRLILQEKLIFCGAGILRALLSQCLGAISENYQQTVNNQINRT